MNTIETKLNEMMARADAAINFNPYKIPGLTGLNFAVASVPDVPILVQVVRRALRTLEALPAAIALADIAKILEGNKP